VEKVDGERGWCNWERRRVDEGGSARENGAMTVTLNERTEQLVKEQLEAGHYASAEEAVNRMIEEHWAESLADNEELEAALLAALDSPRHVYREGELLERAKRRVAEQRSA
jgi:Arc/MetJ-type ribon-helix-helix transcriptional regulator